MGSPKDPDRDNVTLRFLWFKDGVQQSFSPTSTQVPSRLVKAGQMWSCRAIAIDEGDQQSQPSDSDTVAVRETAKKDAVSSAVEVEP
jgi:hypothetical protein